MAYIGRSPSLGNYESIDDISPNFNGATTTFDLKTGGAEMSVGVAQQMIISLGGVIQEPGVDYTLPQANQISFTTAPDSSDNFFGVVLGQTLDVGAPTDGSVNSTKVATGFSLNTDWAIQDSVYSASVGDRIMANTAGGGFQINLPNMAGETEGQIEIVDINKTWEGQNLTVASATENIEGDTSLICDVEGLHIRLVFDGTEWKVF